MKSHNGEGSGNVFWVSKATVSFHSLTDLSLFNHSEGLDLIFIDKTPPFYIHLLLIFIKIELHNYNVI